MRPSSSTSEGLFDGVLGRGGAGEQVRDAAWLRALLDVEAALVQACAAVGLVPQAAADAIGAACEDEGAYDVVALGRAAADTGNPVVPLLRAIEQLAGPDAGRRVHHGATSQDVLDTAAVLVATRACTPLLADLRTAADAAARLAAAHRDTVVAGRTLLQQAVPTTFGLKAAGWALALDDAAVELARAVELLPVQLGGAVGTLALYGDRGPEVVAGLARLLGLRAPVLPWHASRGPVTRLAGALGTAAAAAGGVALDVCLLAQTEVGEVREGPAGRGGSSTMPHKRNPVAAVSARAAALQAPGLVATLLTAAGGQEHERAAGAWHAEWEPLGSLLRSTGSAAAWLADCLSGLQVDADRMLVNVTASGGAGAEGAAEALSATLGRAAAHDVVAAAVARSRTSGRTLAAELADDPACSLDAQQLLHATTPGTGCAGALVDRALASRPRPSARTEDQEPR